MCAIREEFLEFILCDDGISGAALSTKILDTLSEYGLDPNLIRGQGYNGAGNMAGKCRGAAACIQRLYPKAVYVHCALHTLNLCVVAACEVKSTKNMTATLVQIYIFFSFPKRQLQLEKQMEEMNFTDSKEKNWLACVRHAGWHV